MNIFPRAAVASLLLAAPVCAQEPETVTTAILSYAPAPLPPDFSAFFKTGESVFRFQPSPSNLGVPVVYTGLRRFVLRASEAEFGLPPEELQLKPPLAFVDLPQKSDLVLILAVPGDDGEVRLGAYNISSDSLREGDYRVFNFSSKAVSVILGDQKFTVAPRKDKVVKDSKWHGETLALPLRIATVVNREVTPVYSSFWEHYPMRRNILFMFDGRHPTEPIVFSSFDAGTPPKTEAAQ